MQQFTLEYRVAGDLDGVTPSPVFSVDPASSDYKAPDPDAIYRFEVANLGYVDPDFDTGGSQGDRFLRSLVVDGPSPGVGAVGVVALFEQPSEPVPTLRLLEEVGSLESGQFIIPKGCVFVPQGAVLGLFGLEGNGAADPIVIRLSIDIPDSTVEYAEMLQGCCCEQGEDECTPTSIIDVQPDTFFLDFLPILFTVTGSGFQAGITTVTMEFGDGPPISLDVSNVDVLSDTELTFLASSPGGRLPGGNYRIVVTNGEGCASEAFVDGSVPE